MSYTELQVIHRHVKNTPTGSSTVVGAVATSASSRLFLLPQQNDCDQDDMGLVMKIDSKLKDSTSKKTMRGPSLSPLPATSGITTGSSPSAVRPSAVSSQLCGQGHEVTGWVLRGALFLQTAHIPFIKLTHKMSATIQQKAKLLMPLFFYMSLLVLVAQVCAVVTLFAQSFMPLGMWFLLVCIAILAGMFCYTAVLSNPNNQKRPSIPNQQQLSPTKYAEFKL